MRLPMWFSDSGLPVRPLGEELLLDHDPLPAVEHPLGVCVITHDLMHLLL